MDLHDQQRQRASLAVYGVRDLADPPRAHPPVEALRVRVRLDSQDLGAKRPCPANGVVEQRASYSRAYVLRRHPQVFQLDLMSLTGEGVETNHLSLDDRDVHLVAADEVGGDGKGFLPL